MKKGKSIYMLLGLTVGLACGFCGDAAAGTRKGSVIASEYVNRVNAAAAVRKTRGNIVIAGRDSTVRAFELFRGRLEVGSQYAMTVNRYKRMFGDSINVYCMVIPNAVAYYCPDSARVWTNDEREAINNIYAGLSDAVVPVDAYTVLGRHAAEPVYSRTDHHWAPLGAYYAASEFARVAGVDFKPLYTYRQVTVHHYVGTMYTFSKDMAVKQAPEEFVYYVPDSADYTTTYINYTLDRSRRNVIAETAPETGEFFRQYGDGSSGAYCTFMGGDTKLVKVETAASCPRRLLILKDSYGNALPGYLFRSFRQIHVVDCRYFTRNIVNYIRANGITDILFANNLIHASMESTYKKYNQYLEQRDVITAVTPAARKRRR